MVLRPDQCGFVPGRSTAHNLRTLFAMMQEVDPQQQAAAIVLDATKAFSSLECPYLVTLLKRIGLSPKFINLITLLYSLPSARIRINGVITALIPISLGTMQGCPLSPQLFAIAMEPLAARLRQHHARRGLAFIPQVVLVSLYADDIILYVKNPSDNLEPLIREFVCFGGLSGIVINWSKSVTFPLTEVTTQTQMELPLQWTQDPVKYLGIWISRDPEELWCSNYGRFIDWLEQQIKRWITLPLSLAGRVAIAKMVVLPTLLYFFTKMPLPHTYCFKKRLRSNMIELAWAGKQPRVAWEVLTLPFEQGGLGAPDFDLYYWCAQAQLHSTGYTQLSSWPILHQNTTRCLRFPSLRLYINQGPDLERR